MIFLLTGESSAGKSTVAQEFVKRFTGNCRWAVTREVTDDAGIPIGYEAATSGGERHLLAHQTAVKSDVIVGDHRYHVDKGVIDRMFTEPLRAALRQPPDCFVLDEIGNMQRLSPAFTAAVDDAFAQDIPMLATIRTRDDWTAAYINHPNAYPLPVTPATRDQLPDLLVHIFRGLPLVAELPQNHREMATTLIRQYCSEDGLLQLEKLYDNALRYVTGGRVAATGHNAFAVEGDHGCPSTLSKPQVPYDCPLLTGTGVYAGRSGECSHLMAPRITRST